MCYVQHVEQDLNDVIETLTTEVSSQHKQIERLEWLLMKEGYVKEFLESEKASVSGKQ